MVREATAKFLESLSDWMILIFPPPPVVFDFIFGPLGD